MSRAGVAGIAAPCPAEVVTAGCFHCGEPAPADAPTVAIQGRERVVCCAGCAAAARWINEAGLEDYYRLREFQGNRVATDTDDYRAWDRDDIQQSHVVNTERGREMTLLVEGLRCSACAWLLDRALAKSPGVVAVGVNAVTGRMRLTWRPEQTTLSQLLRRVAALGYQPHLAPGEALDRERRRERNALLLRLGVAAVATIQAMMFSEALYLDTAQLMPVATRDAFRWLTFLLCTPVVFYSGSPFLRGMLRELRARAPGMDTLATSSIVLAYAASVVETLRGGPHVWFDAAAMFVLFLLIARLLERSARLRAGARLDLLARARPLLAWRLHGDSVQQVPVAELRRGDEVRIPADAIAPADGELLDALATFDEALLSGEPRPVQKQRGEAVFAGSTCVGRAARLRVTGVDADTRLSQIRRLAEHAQFQRPRLALVADRWASHFVVAMMVVAVATFAVWWSIDPARAFPVALAVLVAACPCALALAIPAALAAANDGLGRRGVLVLGDDALTRLASIDTVVFDKTGTLTRGEPRIVDILMRDDSDPDLARRIAAALESGSGHPLARAFADAAVAPADAAELIPGQGISGRVDGVAYQLGRAGFAGVGHDDGGVWLAREGVAFARFEIRDPMRPEVPELIRTLQGRGMEIWLASGDGERAVAELALAAGITRVRARLSPEDKLAMMRKQQARGRRVLMVGDGINDAPVLAGADVSMALAGGSSLAQRSADLLLLGDSLRPLPSALALAGRTRRIIGQNLAWALGYNLVAIAIAASGFIHPGFAALGMAGSSLGVTLSALRLARGDATT